MPSRVPKIIPDAQPREILPREKAAERQNCAVQASSKSRFKTETGDGKRNSLPISTAESCQSRSHIRITPAFTAVFFSLFLCAIVNTVIGNGAADRRGVSLIKHLENLLYGVFHFNTRNKDDIAAGHCVKRDIRRVKKAFFGQE